MKVTKNITIDLNSPRRQVVHLMEGDNQREITLTLLKDGMPFDVSENIGTATLVKGVGYIKANGVGGYYDWTSTDEAAVALVTNTTNKWTVRLDEHATDVPGFARIFVKFSLASGETLYAFPITLDVIQTSGGSTDPDQPYYHSSSFILAGAQAARTASMTAPVGVDSYGKLWADTLMGDVARDALLDLVSHVYYSDENGAQYIQNLQNALAAKLASISAVFTQGSTVVYDTDDLDFLRSMLVVTAHFDNGATSTVANYTLSGTLTAGTSTVTVSYGGKTTTFNVTVTHSDVPRGYTQYDYVRYTGSDTTAGDPKTQIKTPEFANLNQNIIEFDFMPYVAQTGTTAGVIGGQKQGTSGNGFTFSFYARTDTKRVSCFSHGSALGINDNPNVVQGKVAHVRLDPGSASPSKLTVDSLEVTAAWTDSQTINTNIGYCGKYVSGTAESYCTLKSFAAIGILKAYNLSNELVGKYVPCVRDSDNQIGIWDTVTETFYTTDTASAATVGATGCVWAVGNWTT